MSDKIEYNHGDQRHNKVAAAVSTLFNFEGSEYSSPNNLQQIFKAIPQIKTIKKKYGVKEANEASAWLFTYGAVYFGLIAVLLYILVMITRKQVSKLDKLEREHCYLNIIDHYQSGLSVGFILDMIIQISFLRIPVGKASIWIRIPLLIASIVFAILGNLRVTRTELKNCRKTSTIRFIYGFLTVFCILPPIS